MRKTLAILVLVALLAALAVAVTPSSGADEQATQSARTINVVDDKFKSGGQKIKNGKITIPTDAKVTFIWGNTSNRHNVTGKSGDGFKSKTTSKPGYRYGHRFGRSGKVICTIHPTTMKLSVFTK